MVDKRKSLSEDLGIPLEDASRILIEKEKSLMQSELKYHIRALCSLLDRMRRNENDGLFSEQMMKELVKFVLARHGSLESLDEITEYIEGLSENYLEKEITDRLKDDF